MNLVICLSIAINESVVIHPSIAINESVVTHPSIVSFHAVSLHYQGTFKTHEYTKMYYSVL